MMILYPHEIKSLAGLPEPDFWNDVPAEVKQAIEQVKDELNGGEGIPHSQIMAEIRDRFLNIR